MKIKISVIVSLLILMSYSNMFAQNSNQYHEMVNQSLRQYIEVKEKFHHEGFIISENLFFNTYLSLDGLPIGFENDIFSKGKGITALAINEPIKKLLKGKRSITIINVIGPKIMNGKLSFTISDSVVYKKNGNVFSAAGGFWVDVEWEYSCETQSWVLTKAESGGL